MFAVQRVTFSENYSKLKLFIVKINYFHHKQKFLIFRAFLKKSVEHFIRFIPTYFFID